MNNIQTRSIAIFAAAAPTAATGSSHFGSEVLPDASRMRILPQRPGTTAWPFVAGGIFCAILDGGLSMTTRLPFKA